MGSVERRLRWLEGHATLLGYARAEEEQVSREACRRLTTDELLAMEAPYARQDSGDASWHQLTERERRAFKRYEEVKEEVRDELRAPPQ